MSIRPVFVGWITLLMQLPFQIFFTLWSGGFIGIMAASLTGRPWAWLPPALIGGAVFMAIPILVYTGRKLNYARTVYRFYPDRVEFEEGFLTINKKVVSFRDVKEVTMSKSFLQQIYGLGTIYLATLATGAGAPASPLAKLGFGSVTASGVSIQDIPNPDGAYDVIKNLIEAQNQSGSD